MKLLIIFLYQRGFGSTWWNRWKTFGAIDLLRDMLAVYLQSNRNAETVATRYFKLYAEQTKTTKLGVENGSSSSRGTGTFSWRSESRWETKSTVHGILCVKLSQKYHPGNHSMLQGHNDSNRRIRFCEWYISKCGKCGNVEMWNLPIIAITRGVRWNFKQGKLWIHGYHIINIFDLAIGFLFKKLPETSYKW